MDNLGEQAPDMFMDVRTPDISKSRAAEAVLERPGFRRVAADPAISGSPGLPNAFKRPTDCPLVLPSERQHKTKHLLAQIIHKTAKSFASPMSANINCDLKLFILKCRNAT